MGTGVGLRQVGYFDCAGGGQVVVEGGIAYIAHMRSPNGTSVVDVRDPKNCRQLATIGMPPGTHSHKVRVGNGLMVVNHEVNGADPGPVPPEFKGGIGIYDVSTPARPREITRWTTAGKGVHRFDFDGRYAYLSATLEGYVGTIVLIMDLKEPARPTEVGRWWMPGQWTAGGEQPTWTRDAHRCHHPLRLGDRLYTSYWLAGFVILDIADMGAPKLVSGLDWSPPFTCPTHTALPLPFDIRGRRYLVVADEDVQRKETDVAAFMWMVDITDERHPAPVGSFQVPGIEGAPSPPMTACHQPCEKVTGTEIPFAWFAQGLRIIDVGDPHSPREVAHFLPDVPAGTDRVSSNDVTVDERGLIYLIDRRRGLTIVERT
ncbi:MAG TPA: hypothetical protein VFA64_17370 [Hyphomicrobiaceae bacterium]|nr:hypothetical protein [Hyphomicrobiaceae bacterium]